MSQLIDYARADADVVRKKFRRRVVMFVIATVVVMVIGGGWAASYKSENFGACSERLKPKTSFHSINGRINVSGIARSTSLSESILRNFETGTVGISMWHQNVREYSLWSFNFRYRTLFILAMIPWIITLIRLIRTWKRRRFVGRVSDVRMPDQNGRL